MGKQKTSNQLRMLEAQPSAMENTAKMRKLLLQTQELSSNSKEWCEALLSVKLGCIPHLKPEKGVALMPRALQICGWYCTVRRDFFHLSNWY